MPPALWGLAAAGGVSALAAAAGWLTLDGAVAATGVGTAVVGWGGLTDALALVGFFVSASVLGRLPGRERHGARNWRQVVANGGAAALAALGAGWHAWQPAADAAVLAALAAAAADTWATELGTRFGGTPRRWLFGADAGAGDSGGMTFAGTLGGMAGAAFIVGIAAVAAPRRTAAAHPSGALIIVVAGVLGMLIDSALGASIQVRYLCSTCGALVETKAHTACGGAICTRASGWAAMDNDAVNLAATLAAALIAVVAVGVFG